MFKTNCLSLSYEHAGLLLSSKEPGTSETDQHFVQPPDAEHASTVCASKGSLSVVHAIGLQGPAIDLDHGGGVPSAASECAFGSDCKTSRQWFRRYNHQTDHAVCFQGRGTRFNAPGSMQQGRPIGTKPACPRTRLRLTFLPRLSVLDAGTCLPTAFAGGFALLHVSCGRSLVPVCFTSHWHMAQLSEKE